MLRVIRGDRATVAPFGNYTSETRKPTRYPIQRIEAREDMESGLGCASLAPMFKSFFNNKVRNAFYQSDYVLFENEFRYFDKGIAVAVPLDDVMVLIERAINFLLLFLKLYVAHRRSYTESKVIRGRIAPGMDIRVLVGPGFGLVGLRAG